MPQIIVIADTPGESGAQQVMFRERVTKRDLESGHFTTQLAERLGWAVGDAHAFEHSAQERRIDATATDEDVSAETPQLRSARVVTTAS